LISKQCRRAPVTVLTKEVANRVKQENKTIRGHTQRSGSKQLDNVMLSRRAALAVTAELL